MAAWLLKALQGCLGANNGKQVAASFKGLRLTSNQNSYLTQVSPDERNSKQLALFDEVLGERGTMVPE